MANEFSSITFALTLTNGLLTDTIPNRTYQVTQTTPGKYEDVWNVGTSEESLTAFGGITNGGLCWVKNLDLTNYIDIGPATTVYLIRLKPGEFAFFRLLPAADLFAKANTAAVNLHLKIYSD